MIRIVHEKENRRSAAYDGGREIGCCEYELSPGGWIVTHTETDPAYGGQGVGRRLVQCLAEAAEAERVALDASCSFARKVLGL